MKLFGKLESETHAFKSDFAKQMEDLVGMNEKHLHHKDKILENQHKSHIPLEFEEDSKYSTKNGVKSSFLYQE